ncbi:MAG: Smr/MutS family protein [Pseudomonadota bacterium]
MSQSRKDDKDLWDRVKRTTKPLQHNRFNPDEFVSKIDHSEKLLTEVSRPPQRTIKPYVPEPAATSVSRAPKPGFLDEPMRRKIAKGRIDIEGRIDLHGMTQADAHRSLFRFLQASRLMGRRTVLVITGKGVRGEGILRQAVPRWINQPEFRALASGFHEAHANHGGGGALYVRIRRIKPKE